ncbi:uncharacterized protein LOC106165708 isoform X2 [Lingula anatina]|uniref:Uncharacterized protein LOC106165708 isoform X2 n=1 Tax=Lingula anatina TaxID=7574 RepID=A0A1S3IMQ0_LINAN|nr:uncharacterized protein LOC106165708 isoform X2 [Lingula anatina]|eukprot:XP_013399477.1 uncharacterized protein LOC106165708 isoform X2 [Lingula anatina]
MRLTKATAFEILELPVGADEDSVLTSYKRLALKWHPDKHQNSDKSVQKFNAISAAFKRLTVPNSSDKTDFDLSLPDMFELFQKIFFARTTSYNGYNTSDDEYDYDDESDLEDDVDYLSLFADKVKTKHDLRKQKIDTGQTWKKVSPEEAEKNAEELITEEEKEKRKAEKRRAKKKRQRERKRIEKQVQEQQEKEEEEAKKKSSKQKSDESHQDEKQEKQKPNGRKIDKQDSDSEEEFDPSSAFFTKVVSKKKKGGIDNFTTQSKKETKKDPKNPEYRKNQEDEEAEELDPIVLRSRQLAIRGNEMANLGHYNAAIDLFTEAIKLDSRDFRFFGNRSYCFDRLQQYEKALRDADKAIHLAIDWAKGFFRKGRALAGLKLYADAEQAFMQVLKLDRHCEDAMQELLRVRTYQLTEMGFSRQQAENAIRQHGTVQAALDSLLAGVGKAAVPETTLEGEVYVSDEDDYNIHVQPAPARVPPVILKNNIQPQIGSDVKMDPCNPEGLTALWVGNVLPEVTEKKLTQLFSKFGTITNMRMLPGKYCAFINFKTPVMASKAMNGMQGFECAGQRLLIKFPDNPITNTNILLKKNASGGGGGISKPTLEQLKTTGPVNGDECYFWRTTGCHYGNKCHFKHLPEHRGVDKKPWQKVK